MTVKFTIKGRLPGLNEYSDAERTNRHKAAAIKKDTQEYIGWQILSQISRVCFENPVRISILWVEADTRRDKDNIAFAIKFLLDALVNCKVLKNDGWKEIIGFSHDFAVDKTNPRVEVTIEEIGGTE